MGEQKKFLLPDGWPPFATGMMWSMQGESGCGNFSRKSTGLPQMPQTFCVM